MSGASRGIGAATAIKFAQNGAHLILVGRDHKALKSVSSQIKRLGGTSQEFVVDLSKASEIKKHFSEINKIDVAVNNAGTEGAIADVNELTSQDFEKIYDLNVKGLFLCVAEQVKKFKKSKTKGSIINVASIAGQRGFPGSSLYCSTKFAVLGITKAVAVEQIKNGIRVNSVSPGGTDTEMLERIYHGDMKAAAASHPIGRLATPTEIANGIYWLASKESEFVVGHDLVIDGGRTV